VIGHQQLSDSAPTAEVAIATAVGPPRWSRCLHALSYAMMLGMQRERTPKDRL